MSKKGKTKAWLKSHVNDPYVKAAQQHGHRSRASFKLIEFQDKYQFIKQRENVCDLGAAPGSWSELAKKWVGPKGKVVACDLLEMEPIDGVIFIQGDFTETSTQKKLRDELNDQLFDIIISDMAPNTTGHQETDKIRSISLTEKVLYFCNNNLKKNGNCLVKVFQGSGFDSVAANFKKSFARTSIKKPQASKSSSKEVYIFATGFKG